MHPFMHPFTHPFMHPLMHPQNNIIVHDKQYCSTDFMLSLFSKQEPPTTSLDVVAIYTFVTLQERQTFIQQINTDQFSIITGECWLIGEC